MTEITAAIFVVSNNTAPNAMAINRSVESHTRARTAPGVLGDGMEINVPTPTDLRSTIEYEFSISPHNA